MLTRDNCEQLMPLLDPNMPINTVPVTIKMIGRIFESQPPRSVASGNGSPCRQGLRDIQTSSEPIHTRKSGNCIPFRIRHLRTRRDGMSHRYRAFDACEANEHFMVYPSCISTTPRS